MTVKSDQRKIIYSGNGVTTQFAVPFYFINNADIQASVNDGTTTTDLVLGTDYTLTGAGVETGGTLTTVSPVASGSEIAILRTVAYKQEMDIPENDIFPSQNMERALDRLTMQTQQLNEQMGRAVTVDVFSDANPAELVGKIEDLWGIKDDMTTVAGISSEVSDVSANKSNINAAVSNEANINAAVANETNINAVVANATNINAAVANESNINTAVANESNINAAVANETNINAVVANETNINAAVANESNINTAVSNMAAIIDAPNQAASAAASAADAQVWAEGTDVQVQALGGVHSSKVWAEQSTNANIDLSNLSQTGEAHFQAPLVSGTNIKTVNFESLLGAGDIQLAKKDFSNATKPYVNTSYQNGDSGYIKLSNGFTVQWGNIAPTTGSNTVTFLIPFTKLPAISFTRLSDFPYSVGNINVWSNIIQSRERTHFVLQADGGNQSYISWLAFGF